jgi:hypothetical protein
MAEYKEMKKNLILTRIALLASSGGSEVWRDGMFPQLVFELYNWEKDNQEQYFKSTIFMNTEKQKLKDNKRKWCFGLSFVGE